MRTSVIYTLLAGLALGSAPADAQAPTTLVTCESLNNRYVECPVQVNSQVRLVRTLGGSCVAGRTYAAEREKIWVKDGCRGVFEVKPQAREPEPERRPKPLTYLLRCESIRNQTAECPVDPAATVALARQLSGVSCTEGQNWGAYGASLFVSRGCRGEFEVTRVRRPGNFGRPGNTGYEITCESWDGGMFSCRIGEGDTVVLDQTLSRRSCVEGTSWGVSGSSIWVDDGCRAEFRITKRN